MTMEEEEDGLLVPVNLICCYYFRVDLSFSLGSSSINERSMYRPDCEYIVEQRRRLSSISKVRVLVKVSDDG